MINGCSTFHHTGHLRLDDYLLNLGEATSFGLLVLPRVLLERISDLWPSHGRPLERKRSEHEFFIPKRILTIERRYVHLVNGFTPCRGQTSKQPPVESAREAEDGKLGTSRRLIMHARAHLLGSKVQMVRSFSLTMAIRHESCFESGFVGARSAPARELRGW